MPAFLLDSAAIFKTNHNGGSMQGSPFQPIILALILFASLASFSQSTLGDQDLPREQLPSSWKLDAELTDVFFLDANRGWAVGAQGVIVRTVDGGKTWNEISQVPDVTAGNMSLDQKFRNMRSGVQSRSTGIANGSSSFQPMRCRFESVFFVNEKLGWVAGGYDVPYVDRSRAVVMRTRDGGETWNAVTNLVVPRFNRIHFSDPANGWAIGKTGNLFQAGVFFTSDGGISWSSQSSEKSHAWVDAARTDTGFVTVNDVGRLGVIRSNEYEPSVMLQDSGARISQVRMIDNQHGCAVGEYGTVLHTNNGGLSWTDVEIPEIAKAFDFRCVTTNGSRIWFAGDPGTFLFSVDLKSGQSTSIRTPNNARINRIHFADEQNGWAVGALGGIIATIDGGQTWRIQRGQNQRAAILCVSPDEQSLPFEILSRYATEENQICATMILSQSDVQNQTATQATERLGSSILISNTAPPLSTGDATEKRQQMLERLVRVIRTLQPNLIVCNAKYDFATGGKTLVANPAILIQEAIRMAADGNSFPHQINDMGLKFWQVDRLATFDPSGDVTIDPGRLLPRTGVLIEDQISLSRALVGQSVLSDPPSRYRVTHFTNRDRMNAGNLLSGLDPRKAVTPRDERGVKRGNLNMIQQANAKHKKFEQFVRFEANTPQDLVVWRQQVQSFALKMDQDVAGVWLMQLAERYLAVGKTELAANTATLLVTHWANHAFAPASLAWLSQYYASEEFGQIEFLNRVADGQIERNGELTKAQRIRNDFVTAPQPVQHAGSSHLVWVPTKAMLANSKDNEFEPEVSSASNEETATPARREFFNARLTMASQFLSRLSQRDPELAAGPQYQLLEAQISRRLNGVLSNEGRYLGLVQQRDFNGAGIAIAAQRELGLAGRLPLTSDEIQMLVCQKTERRPKLDGLLNEPFWQSAIKNGNVATPAVQFADGRPNPQTDLVIFAYDAEFLYAGFRCQKIEGQYYNSRRLPRPRDADLERRDRIELELDIDRDYRSSNRFVIDHRGWVQEGCGGSLGWNPDWYVSQSEDDTTWTVEIAIPLEQIIPAEIEPESTWAFKVSRRAFRSSNLWDNRQMTSRQIDRNQRIGMQVGLESRPADYELIRFRENETDSAENHSQYLPTKEN